ncbi:MAG: CesT family type III secretion system chaperone [Parachlamydiaceae bacterium]|nr:CesT family type III secretion system chaperone [Parachlamydiaceae bacterium]
MVTDVLGALLQELGSAMQLSNLRPDANNTCLIKFKDGILSQLEVDRSGRFLVIGIDLGEIPKGRYRENLFFEALKANAMPLPRYGIFGYSQQADRLILFEYMNLRDLTGQKIADRLSFLLEKGRVWKEAIAKEDIPVTMPIRSSGTQGIFGLRP